MKKGSKEVVGTLLVLATALISGFNIFINKVFVAKVDPLILTAVRALFIGLIFLAISYGVSKKKKESFKKVSWAPLLFIGVVGGGLAFWLFFEGLKLTTAGRAAFIHKTLPLYAIILAFVFLKEKITKQQIVASALMIAGLVFLESTLLLSSIRLGDFLVLGATVLWACENMFSKRVMNLKETNWVVSFSRMFFGSLVLFALIFILGRASLLWNLDANQILYIAISAFLLLLYVLTYYWGLRYINLSKASVLLLISPVITLVLGITYLHEPVYYNQLLGSALILIGAYVVIGQKSEKRVPSV